MASYAVKQEIIIDKDSNIYGHELLTGMPKDEQEDLNKAVFLIRLCKTNKYNYNYINIFPKTLIYHHDIIKKELDDNTVNNIVFEIVERNSAIDFTALNKAIENVNISISIDDFGTGASNFDRLFYLSNIKSVKIDRVLWSRKDKDSRHIVRVLHAIAEKRRIELIAEKVEKSDEYKYLKDLGITYFQGYLFKDD